MTKNINVNKLRKFCIIISTIIIFTLGASVYNFKISKKEFLINLNLSFNLKNSSNNIDINKIYENIINICDNKSKKNNIIRVVLGNENVNKKYIFNNLIFNPDVSARQLNIEYIAKNKEFGLNLVDNIGNLIIKNENLITQSKRSEIEKKISVSTDKIKVDKKLNVLIFVIWGLTLGIGISLVMEEKCLLKKKR